MSKTTLNHSKALSDLGFTLVSSAPFGSVRENDWPCISYRCTLNLRDREIWSGEFHLGIGHVRIQEFREYGVRGDLGCFISAWKRNPNANFRDKKLQAHAAAEVARQQIVKPSLADVLNSLILDSDCDMAFEEWAANLGYEVDSRKAEGLYKACNDIRHALKRVPAEILEQCREILQDY